MHLEYYNGLMHFFHYFGERARTEPLGCWDIALVNQAIFRALLLYSNN